MSDVIISYSEVTKFQTCKRQYYYRFILGRQPLEESAAVSTGVKGHKLLQNFYEYLNMGLTKDEALEKTTASAMNMIKRGEVDASLLKAWTLVTNYIRSKDFNSKAVLVENRFLLPVAKLINDAYNEYPGVQIGFTPDVVFDHNGFYEVEDAKFVGRAWSKSKLNRFSQAKLYQIFLSRMGYNVTRSSIRFFNTTTSVLSQQNYTLSQAEEEILIHDFMEGLNEVLNYKTHMAGPLERAARTMNYTSCQYCPFEFPCTLEAEGKDASKTLKNMYKDSSYDYTR